MYTDSYRCFQLGNHPLWSPDQDQQQSHQNYLMILYLSTLHLYCSILHCPHDLYKITDS